MARDNLATHFGLIDSLKPIEPGYYHSSVYDAEAGILLDIIKQFDILIILDQSWSDPDMFLAMVELANLSEATVEVQWLDKSYKIDTLFFKNLVETNKSFCIFPFIELLVQNGSTTVCCRSSEPITQLDKLYDWKNNPDYKKIRNKMLSGELIPEHCQTCYEYETSGMISPRKTETVQWANRLGLKSIEDVVNIETPVYYEIRPSNICNLQCRSCTPSSSSLIEKEYIKIGLHDSDKTYKFTNFDFVDFTNLKSLYVAGGEPTVMPELYDFLEKCIADDNVDFDFTINTNAVKFSNKLKDLICHFTNLQFIVSIDGYKDVNHYVRWPSNWDSIIDNVHYLINHNHKVIVQSVVSIWTIPKLYELINFIENEFPDLPIQGLLAKSENDLFNPFNFPDPEIITNNLYQITKLNCYRNDLVFKEFIDNLIKYFETQHSFNKQRLHEFFNFNDKLDQSRNIRLKDYIPELDRCRKYLL